MTTFRVYAHPFPTPPSQWPLGTPPNVPPPGPGVIDSYWCELLDQATIDSKGYGPPGVIPTSEPDTGYTVPGATDFTVTRICIQITFNYLTAYRSPFEYTLISPTGQVIQFPTPPPPPVAIPASGGGWEFCTAAYVPQAKGVWRIDVSINPAYAGVSYPTIGTWPNHVRFVMPHGRREGILAVEFEGTEVFCPTVTTQVQLGQCNPDGTRQQSSLLLNFTPVLAPGTSYNINWYTAIAPPINVTGTIPPGPSPQMISYPPNFTLYPAVSGTITPPGGQPCSFSSTFEFPVGSSGVTIPSCP
jgi:hypothetical protein